MGLITIPELLYPSPTLNDPSSGYSLQSGPTPNSSGERMAYIFRVPKTGTLDLFEFPTSLHTGTWTMRASFQDVGADGNPDGTVDQYRSVGQPSAGWQVPGLMTSDGTDGGTKRSVTKGDLLACVLDYTAYTSGGFFANIKGAVFRVLTASSYCNFFDGTSWTKQATAIPPIALKYSDGIYYMIAPHEGPYSASTSLTTFNSSSSPDEIGHVFTWPYGKAQAIGVWVEVDADADFDVVLYDAGGNVVASQSQDSDMDGDSVLARRHVYFATPAYIYSNRVYRVILKPTTTSNIGYAHCTLANAAHRKAWPPGGRDDVYWTQRTDAGSWTDTTTKRTEIGIIVGQLDLVAALVKTPRSRVLRSSLR